VRTGSRVSLHELGRFMADTDRRDLETLEMYACARQAGLIAFHYRLDFDRAQRMVESRILAL
jgi:hypothetical protein